MNFLADYEKSLDTPKTRPYRSPMENATAIKDSVDWEKIASEQGLSVEAAQTQFARVWIEQEFIKEAMPSQVARRWTGAGLALTAPFAALGLIELGKEIYQGLHEHSKRGAVLEHLKSLYPEEQHAMVDEAYHSIQSVAPKIAMDPLLARSVLKSMMAMMTHAQHGKDSAPITDFAPLSQAVALSDVRNPREGKSLLKMVSGITRDVSSVENYVTRGSGGHHEDKSDNV